MAEKLCTLRTKGGGGGRYTETSLWTNPSPNVAFSAQTVTLSDSLSNYKYVAIYYKYAGTTDGVNDPMSVIVPVDKFKTSLKNNSTRHNILVLGAETNGNAGWTRNVFYASDTTIEFDTGYRQNVASSSGDICVPTEILGLNELDHGEVLVETGTFTSPTIGNTITITCGFEPKKIYLSMYVSSSRMYVISYDIAMDSTHQVTGWRASSSSADCTAYAFPNSSNNGVLVSISSTGFVYKGGTTSSNQTVYYTVIG